MKLDNPRPTPRDALAALRPPVAATPFPRLHVAGSLEGLAAPCIAVVGSRAPSEAGRRLARATARELARAGVCVVSGLALGIDAAAHQGALDAGAPTIGVLGGGHRRFHPAHNRSLAERMLAGGGGVVSPFAPDEQARPWQFIQRNALIAAFADAVLVVEAAARSGSLNTAGWAGDLGVPVLAFPGDVERPKVAGCLALIRDGATLVRGTRDVLEAIGICLAAPSEETTPSVAASAEEDPTEHALLARLQDGEATLDELLESTGLAHAAASAALGRLAMIGRIEPRAGARFALCSCV